MNLKENKYSQFYLCREMMDTVDVIRKFNPASADFIVSYARQTGHILFSGEGSTAVGSCIVFLPSAKNGDAFYEIVAPKHLDWNHGTTSATPRRGILADTLVGFSADERILRASCSDQADVAR